MHGAHEFHVSVLAVALCVLAVVLCVLEVVCVLAGVLCVLEVVCVLAVVFCCVCLQWCCVCLRGEMGGEGGEKVCVCMMVVGSANVAEVKWVDSCGGGWKTACIQVGGCGGEMWP